MELFEIKNNLEQLKEIYKVRLNKILYKELTVENINSFGDDTMQELLSLNDEILTEYRNNNLFEPKSVANTREQEDDAYLKLDLLNLQEILKKVIEVKETIDILKKYIEEKKVETQEILIPTKNGNATQIINNGGENNIEKILVPRLLTLLYILESDLNIHKENIKIIKGQTNSKMLRKTSYVRVEIEELGRIVYVCDEEDNASYIFDTAKLKEGNINIEDINKSDKGTLNELLEKNPGIGVRVKQTMTWRDNVSLLLKDEITIQEKLAIINKSEFEKKRKKEWPSFEFFQNEVRLIYSGGSIHDWYDVEKKNHKDTWPPCPDKTYKNKGWEGWPELIGMENVYKREYLSFEELKKEVIEAYKKDTDEEVKGDIELWYSKEKKYGNHNNWSPNPRKDFKNKGWEGWPALVNKENRLGPKIPLADLKIIIRDLYINIAGGKGSKAEFYEKVRIEKGHKEDWPSDPLVYYNKDGKNKECSSWEVFFGYEKIIRLTLEELKAEVQSEFSKEKDKTIKKSKWYSNNKKKHKNWPDYPPTYYRKVGWTNWDDLFGDTKTN